MSSITGFLRQYLRPRDGFINETEVSFKRGDETLAATLYRPSGARGKMPAWVLLHGLTYTGRQHPSLVRFARAVSASGSIVFVPDIPEWKRLQVAPAITHETIVSAAIALHDQSGVDHERTGLIGFSFGATQALIAAAEPAVQKTIRGIAAWGGYCDVHRLFRFGITGEHELDGVQYQANPDPYGAWIMCGNYLRGIPGHEHHGALAAAFLELAYAAGKSGVYAWEPRFDPLKMQLRETLNADELELFDLVARPTTVRLPDLERARKLAIDLANAALRTDPLLDPQPYLPRIGIRTFIAHGRDDRLVPFTESTRLERLLDPKMRAGYMITSLFAHSGGTRPELGRIGIAKEGVRFVRLLKTILDLV